MEQDPQTTLGHINRGIAAYHMNDLEHAKEHLAQAILSEPVNEIAWLWMAEVCEDPKEQRYSLERAVRINPDSIGEAKRLQLLDVVATIPTAIADIETPPLPPQMLAVHTARTGRLQLSAPKPIKTLLDRSVQVQLPIVRNKNMRLGRWTWLSLASTLIACISFALILLQSDASSRYIAVIGPMSGTRATQGQSMLDGVQLAVEELNRAQPGPRLKVLVFDDEADPVRAAELAREIVDDDRILLVIGHGDSTTSLAAAPIYAEAHLTAITSVATSDDLTEGNPWYFRTIFRNSTEGALISTYARHVLGATQAIVVSGPGIYEQTLATAFRNDFAGDAVVTTQLEIDHADRAASITAAVDALLAADKSEVVILTLSEDDAHAFLLESKRRGVTLSMLGDEALGNVTFARTFANEPEEAKTPGYFTNGMYAISPLIYDGVGGDALAFEEAFSKRFGEDADWISAKSHDAVTLANNAIHRAVLVEGDIETSRTNVRDALASINSPDTALRGLTGPLFFDSQGEVPQTPGFGVFTSGIFLSAPVQYRLVIDDGTLNNSDPKLDGSLEVNGQTFRPYRVVYVGVQMIDIRDLDTSKETYTGEFFIYFLYEGDRSALDIVFTNSTDPALTLGTPLESSVAPSGINYELFRVRGTFSQPMDFEDYPWDKQLLQIRFLNSTLGQADVVYVPELTMLQTPQSERLASGFDQSLPFNHVPSWTATRLDISQVSITADTDSYDPTTSGSSLAQYSELRIGIHLERDVTSFLVKNLLPLALLAMVTYISLFFSPEQAGTRITFAITSVLTSSVMLGSISSRLPNIGYSVAIEWGFYIYIVLSGFLVLLNIAIDRSFKAKRFIRVRQLNLFGRYFYPAVVIGTIGMYWWQFG